MAFDDIKDALTMFQQGVKEFQLGRSISAANDQVQQIRASDLADTEKHAQLQQISNGLVSQLAAHGTPDTTIESVRSAFGGAQPKSAEEMMAKGIYNGDPALLKMGTDLQAHELKKQQMMLDMQRQKWAMMNESKNAKNEAGQATDAAKMFSKFDDSINPEKQVRSALGQSSLTVQRGERILELAGHDLSPQALSKLPNENIAEMATSVAQMVKSGVPGTSEIKQFIRPTIAETASAIQQYWTSNPQPANRGPLAKLLVDVATREMNVSKMQQQEYVLNQASKAKSMIRAHPELESDIKSTIANRLKISPDDVNLNVDNKEAPTTTQKQSMDQKLQDAETTYNRAKMDINGSDPVKKQNAQRFFQMTGVDPKKNNKNEAMIILKHYLAGVQ